MLFLYLLLWLILILLLISLIFYNNVRVRNYFFTNTAQGDDLNFTLSTDNYYTVSYDTNKPLEFIPLYQDRKSTINGGLSLLTEGSVDEFYQVRVMDGSKVLSTSLQKVRPGPSYMRMTYTSGSGNNRKLRIQLRKYDTKLQKFIAGQPSFKLISAWAYYY